MPTNFIADDQSYITNEALERYLHETHTSFSDLVQGQNARVEPDRPAPEKELSHIFSHGERLNSNDDNYRMYGAMKQNEWGLLIVSRRSGNNICLILPKKIYLRKNFRYSSVVKNFAKAIKRPLVSVDNVSYDSHCDNRIITWAVRLPVKYMARKHEEVSAYYQAEQGSIAESLRQTRPNLTSRDLAAMLAYTPNATAMGTTFTDSSGQTWVYAGENEWINSGSYIRLNVNTGVVTMDVPQPSPIWSQEYSENFVATERVPF